MNRTIQWLNEAYGRVVNKLRPLLINHSTTDCGDGHQDRFLNVRPLETHEMDYFYNTDERALNHPRCSFVFVAGMSA